MSAVVNDVSGYSLALRRLEEKKDYIFLQFLSTIMYFKGSSACQRDIFLLQKKKKNWGETCGVDKDLHLTLTHPELHGGMVEHSQFFPT